MSGAVLVSSCKGNVFTTIAHDEYVRLCGVLELDPTDREHFGAVLAGRAAAILREIHRGRGVEFAHPDRVQALARRLLELGTIGSEAGPTGIVRVR